MIMKILIMLNAGYRQLSFTPKCAEWDDDFTVDDHKTEVRIMDDIFDIQMMSGGALEIMMMVI